MSRMRLSGSLRVLFVGALALLGACSKDKDVDRPAPLSDIRATLAVRHAWSASLVDRKARPLRLGLDLAVADGRVYAAGHRGDVLALELRTGRTLWRTRTRAPLSGGVAVGADLVAVGAANGEAIALDARSGSVRWRTRLNGEILAAPAISERVVAYRTVDGRIHGLAPADGHELWSQEQQVPRLSLRGTSTPVLAGDLAVCGFDNGKVMAVNLNDGTMQWEATIAPPHGRTELERLVDIDAAVRVVGQDVYAVGFQGKVAMLALDNGQIWWSHEASSYRNPGIDDEALYLATSDGEVVALRRRTGAEIWRQKALLHRGLTGVAASPNGLVTADAQGYVHWLDRESGALLARVRAGKRRISNVPIAVDDMVLVMNDEGQIRAFRVAPLHGAAPAPRAAAEAVPAPTGSGGGN